jgi:lipopolysaccharide export system protein LptA
MQLHNFYRFLLTVIICLLAAPFVSRAQFPSSDTTKLIKIIRANSLNQKTLANGTVLNILAGNAVVKQGNTILSGDSIAFDPVAGVAEVFGNVHINDADSVHTYAQYLKYIGPEQMAYLKKNVKLTDGRGTLYTDDLEYNLATGIANYKNGGRVVNGTTVLTSRDAVYYSDTKDVTFKRTVHLVDPKYDMTADSLRYNTAFKTATFISPTHIISKNGIIDTRSGTYNLDTGEAVFDEHPFFSDSTHSMTGDHVAIDEKTGIVAVEGRGKLVDSASNVIVLADQIFLDRKKNAFLATRKPVMILYQKNDSTYVAADTLFSGLRMYDTTQRKNTALKDTAANEKKGTDTLMSDSSDVLRDSIHLPLRDTPNLTLRDSNYLIKDTAINLRIGTTPSDSIRYFLAFHHVRIFNDSMQAVSDSLYYSTEDSVFRLFKDPVFWNDKTQVNGDTMYLFTENRKPKQLYVFNNSLVINKPEEGVYNQMGGRTLNAYFRDGAIDYIRVKGSPAESIFYPQDDDSAYVGMNRSSGDVIDIFFVTKELNKVKFVNNVNGTLYPLKDIPKETRYLKGFNWMDKRRPKNKLELFE